MAIRYDKELNAEIKRIVYNYNRKRKRAKDRGVPKKFLPDKVFVSSLKTNYTNRGDLLRELRNLQRFNELGSSAFKIVETAGGGRLSKYQFDYIKRNIDSARQFYDQQINDVNEIVSLEKHNHDMDTYLITLQNQRQTLDLDINTLTPSQVKTITKYIDKSKEYNEIQSRGYRGFLKVVDNVMQILDYDESTINEFFEKMGNLTPTQFLKMYLHSDLIGKIYDLIPSPPIKNGRLLTSDDEDAKAYIDALLESFDTIKEESLQ